MQQRFIALWLFVISSAMALSPAVGQTPSSGAAPHKPRKVARAPVAPRVLPDCDFGRAHGSRIQRARLGAPPVDVMATHCSDNDGPLDAYVIDMRTSRGDPWLKVSIQSSIAEKDFSFAFLDLTGDGLPDLVVPTAQAGAGPYAATDLYKFDPQQRTFRRDEKFPGISWPSIAQTKGCAVFEERADRDTYVATRFCRNAESGDWVRIKSCNLVDRESCPKALLW